MNIERDIKSLNLDDVDFSENWSWGIGGYFGDGIGWIGQHFVDDEKVHMYKLPDCISGMIVSQFNLGVAQARYEMQYALGINEDGGHND
jgi:hypothetical protein